MIGGLTCPSCGEPNPDAAKFCGECGSALVTAVACKECGTENPPGQRFCNECGTRLTPAPADAPPDPRRYTPAHLARKIAASREALAGERKQVTVLFADVQESMNLSESVDAEVWRGVMERCFQTICDGVHRFEGTVDKFTGDGAMALFGAPIAHEDHARRACYAALALRDSLDALGREVRREHGLNFSVRMGLNSGEVVVGAVGEDLDMDYTAIGHTVGLAARMEALAEPGKPYLTRSTAALVEGWFELEEIGELRVKGVREPVRSYALAGPGRARTRLDIAAARGLSRFVGRDDEMRALEVALAGLDEGDGGQVVGVVADAGLGKSRLCREFADRCRARGIEVTVGTGLAHGRRIPLLPVIEMMRGYFGVAEDDDGRTARDKIAGRLLLLDEAFREQLPVLFDFLGVPDPEGPPIQGAPEARQRALFAAVTRLVQARAGAGPGVVIVEDLHWLDPGSEAFLRNLVESLPGARTLVVANFRPEYQADWMQKSYYRRLPLVPLGREAIESLVKSLTGDHPSLDGVAEVISERTGGNPFFIEEVVMSLAERGTLTGRPGAYTLAGSIDEIEIPATVHALLDARIDRLGETEKAVLQSAAVVGREFTEPVLRAIAGLPEDELADALDALCRSELLFERALYPVAEYAFKHPLIEEVTYRSQLAGRRARLHAAAARALEELHGDRVDELASLISTHWERAGEQLKAAQFGARAAGWAGQTHPADAIRNWRRVRKLLRGDESEDAKGLRIAACLWTLQFGWRLGLDDDEIREVFAEVTELGEGNAWVMAVAYGGHAISRGNVGAVNEALAESTEARRIAETLGSNELAASVGSGYWLSIAGRNREALQDIEDAHEMVGDDYQAGRETIGFSVAIWCTFFRGLLLAELGSLTAAREYLERGLQLAREHDDVESLGWSHGGLGLSSSTRASPATASPTRAPRSTSRSASAARSRA